MQALDAPESLAACQVATINQLSTAESRTLAKAEMLAGPSTQPCFRLKARQHTDPVERNQTEATSHNRAACLQN